jgi:hypothetical protein
LPLEDYLLPNENIQYQSNFDVLFRGKPYTVVLTDVRLVLYARRGLLVKSDDVVTEAIRDIQGIRYRETGMLVKKAQIELSGKSKLMLGGDIESLKALHQRLLPFLSPELRQTPQPNYPTPPQAHSVPRNCPSCGIEVAQVEKFCHNCGKQLD